jgi:nicotinamidase-related amidase
VRLDPEWLIVTGVWTEACVAKTLFDAQAAGLRVLLVKDAIGSGTAFMHQAALLHLANRLYGGAVTDTDIVLRLIAGETAPAWQVEGVAPIRFTAETVTQDYQSL